MLVALLGDASAKVNVLVAAYSHTACDVYHGIRVHWFISSLDRNRQVISVISEALVPNVGNTNVLLLQVCGFVRESSSTKGVKWKTEHVVLELVDYDNHAAL